MNKFVKLIITDICLAAAAVIMYSPGLLDLRPSDSSILRAGCSIMGVLVLAYGFIKTNIISALETHNSLAIGMENVDDCIRVLREVDTDIFKTSVEEAVRQLGRAKNIENSFHVVVDEKFPPGSMSNDKFNSTASMSITAIVKNCRAMVARIQMFDERDYMRIRKLIKTGEYLRDDIPDSIQEEKYAIYEKNHSAIKDMVNNNEKILIRLDALVMEISTLDSRDISVENNDIINEIEDLIEQTKYYQ